MATPRDDSCTDSEAWVHARVMAAKEGNALLTQAAVDEAEQILREKLLEGRLTKTELTELAKRMIATTRASSLEPEAE